MSCPALGIHPEKPPSSKGIQLSMWLQWMKNDVLGNIIEALTLTESLMAVNR